MRTADQEYFTASTQMSGSLVHFEPGALRQMHWHTNEAEWQFVINGTLQVWAVLVLQTGGSVMPECIGKSPTYSALAVQSWLLPFVWLILCNFVMSGHSIRLVQAEIVCLATSVDCKLAVAKAREHNS